MKTASPLSKKAQIQMMETIMVLVVFFIILIIAIFFYYKFRIADIEQTGEQLKIEKYSFLLSSIPQMPEIKCTELGQEKNCIDSFKILAFRDTLAQESYYKSLFQNTEITIEITYPEPKTQQECTQIQVSSTDFPENCNYFTLYKAQNQDFSSSIIISTPASLYMPHLDTYKLSKLKIRIPQK